MSSRGLQPAPANYQCPYRRCCPHLQGFSTEFLFEEYQQSRGEHVDHWKARDDLNALLDRMRGYTQKLEAQNAELKAKLTTLHRRQFKGHRKSPSAGEPTPARPNFKKRGAPLGHLGWFRRKPAKIDETLIVPAPQVCPHCRCTELTPLEGVKDHVQEDIRLSPRTHVTCFKHQQAFCPRCRRPVIQAAAGEMLNCPIGPKTKALAVFYATVCAYPIARSKSSFRCSFAWPLFRPPRWALTAPPHERGSRCTKISKKNCAWP